MSNNNFPLEQWFDLSKKIEKKEVEDAIDQISWYAMKDGLTPNSKEYKQTLNQLRKSVKEFNKKL